MRADAAPGAGRKAAGWVWVCCGWGEGVEPAESRPPRPAGPGAAGSGAEAAAPALGRAGAALPWRHPRGAAPVGA